MLWLEQSWLLLLVDVSIKSIALALVAWAGLTTCRVRNANVRHRVWSAVLLSMMALPLLVPVSPTVPLPAWLIPSFSAPTKDEPSSVVQFEHAVARNSSIELIEPLETEANAPRIVSDPEGLVANRVDAEPFVAANDNGLSPELAESGAIPFWSRAITWLLGHWAAVILAIYSVVCLGFLTRITAGIWCTHRIVARSSTCAPGVASANAKNQEDSERLGRTMARSIPILMSHDLAVPLTVGFLRPIILLPADWLTWSPTKLQSVIAHESAHIRRGDYLVTLLAEFNRAVHWFNPLSWLLRRWLSDLAEQNCDDAVILATGERAQYARHLLEVASSLHDQKHRVAWAGVAMARKPNVETRIDAILDSKRPLSRRIGIVGGLLLVIMAIPAVLLTAALRPEAATAKEQNVSITSELNTEADPRNAWKPLIASLNDLANQETVIKHSSVRVRGQVVGPDGKGTRATIHLVSSYSGGLIRAGREEILSSFETDELGNFDEQRPLPERSNRVDLGIGPGVRVEQIVATAKGFGPAVNDVIGVRAGDAVTLRLAKDDVPIEGRILDLEGQPVNGATLRLAILKPAKDLEKTLANLRVRAGEKPQGIMLGTFMMSAAFDADRRFLNERSAANKLSYSGLLSKPVTTEGDGRFRIDGIGRDRILAIELSGPGIVTSWISVVSRDMEPIGKTIFVGNRTDTTYGAKFTFSAEPDQIVEGRVTDVDTGEPIQGVQLGVPAEQAGLASSTTDEHGDYRITGLPKSKQQFLDLVAPPNSPYLSRRYIEVKDFADGLRRTKLDFQLKRTTWITGKVTNKLTGEPVKARVMFSPHLESELAKAYSLKDGQYIDPIRMKAGADTDAEGGFRVKAIPGEGLLVALCKDYGYCLALGADALDEKWLTRESVGRPAKTKTYHRLLPRWTHSLKIVTAELDEEIEVDLSVDPGNSLKVQLVDAKNEPLTGVHIRNRFPFSWNSDPPLEESSVELLAIDPNNPRTVLFYHRERNLGAFLLADQADRTGERTVTLEACGVVKGRLLDNDGKPLVNIPVGIKPVALKLKNREAVIPYSETDEDGNFVIERFTPSHEFSVLSMYGPEQEFIAKAVEIKPGETRDLGDVVLTKTQSRAQPLILQEDTKETDGGKEDVGLTWSATKVADVGEHSAKPLVYEGQVLLPNGKPANGADIYFNYWRWSSVRGIPANPVAKTDASGHFRFERDAKDIDMESAGAHLVAKLEGYGFATAFSPALERSGYFEAKFSENEEYRRTMQPLLDRDRQPMRLVLDEGIIRGRVVDLEGNGIGGISVSVTELLASVDGTSATWDKAIKDPQVDYVTVSNLFRRQLRGPEVAGMFGVVKTNDDGQFQIRGLGKHRIAKLAISGRNIEASNVFALTNPGKSIALPMQFGGTPDNGYQFHGNQFTHVANASRPVIGRVTEADTGKPIAGAVINSTRTWTYAAPGGKSIRSGSDVAYAVTDADGNYRLDGLPRSKYGMVRAIGVGADFLPHQTNVDTSGTGITPVTKDIQLKRGMVIEGRVTEATTGKGVRGSIEFFRKGSQGRVVPMMGSEGPKMSNEDGHFKIVVPRQDGNVCFTAFERHLYPKKPLVEKETDGAPAPVEGAVMDFRVMNEFHAFQSVRADDTARKPLEWKLQPNNATTGRAIGPDGQPVGGLKYVGQSNRFPHWSSSESGELKIYGMKPKQTRRVVVMCDKQQLAGFVELRNATDGFTVKLEPWATLKGRIVDEDGDALSGAQLMRGSVFGQPLAGVVGELPVDVGALQQSLPLPPVEVGLMTNHRHLADKDGHFEIAGLVPEIAYGITAVYHGDPLNPFSNDIVKQTVLKPGETRDLGTVVLKKPTREQIEGKIQSSPRPVSTSP